MTSQEQNIWTSIQQRDGQVFENFYKQHYKLYYLAACQYLKDPGLAQEVVNDVFLKIWEDAIQINIQTSLKSYIYRAVVNRCLNELGKNKKDLVQRREWGHQSGDVAETREMEVNELKVKLYAAIDRLPEQCRKVFMMSRFEELKQQEIADRLQISIKTVKNHITYALKQLHAVLGDWQSLPVWIILLKYFFER